MIDTVKFYNKLVEKEFDFFTGVPDSLLKNLCACISNLSSENHIIAANEGNAIAMACGYNIATAHYGVVYMQNSGLGNAVNPLLSLADEDVYKIPMLLIIGYRGEPGVMDEPQHKKQGKLTLPLLDTLGIKYLILEENYENQLDICSEYVRKEQKPFALVVKKDSFSPYKLIKKENNNPLTREQVLETIINKTGKNDFLVSTTGKTSREIFEIREKHNMEHTRDFLTVGSMGHASSLAFGMSLNTDKDIYCIDGDGAFIMHMGALAVVVQNAKENFKYILINNGCHESVGSQPTISYNLDLEKILYGFGFTKVIVINNSGELEKALDRIKHQGKTALVVNTNDKSRSNLGRPTITPVDNKYNFEENIRS